MRLHTIEAACKPYKKRLQAACLGFSCQNLVVGHGEFGIGQGRPCLPAVAQLLQARFGQQALLLCQFAKIRFERAHAPHFAPPLCAAIGGVVMPWRCGGFDVGQACCFTQARQFWADVGIAAAVDGDGLVHV